jgi:hypothetical protein
MCFQTSYFSLYNGKLLVSAPSLPVRSIQGLFVKEHFTVARAPQDRVELLFTVHLHNKIFRKKIKAKIKETSKSKVQI